MNDATPRGAFNDATPDPDYSHEPDAVARFMLGRDNAYLRARIAALEAERLALARFVDYLYDGNITKRPETNPYALARRIVAEAKGGDR